MEQPNESENFKSPPTLTVTSTNGSTDHAEIKSNDEPANVVKMKRVKVALAPGHSHLDWIKLLNSGTLKHSENTPK